VGVGISRTASSNGPKVPRVPRPRDRQLDFGTSGPGTLGPWDAGRSDLGTVGLWDPWTSSSDPWTTPFSNAAFISSSVGTASGTGGRPTSSRGVGGDGGSVISSLGSAHAK
jgi:hypothetical protein